MNIAICQLPDDLSTESLAWDRFSRRLDKLQPDLAILNEMPFGPWASREPVFDEYLAAASIDAHEAALAGLRALNCPVISSCPIRNRDRLANEAFLLADDEYRPIHQKQYFPQEPGFFEATWFKPARPGFDIVEYQELRIGVLLCTELMFTEWARHYRRQGANIIAVPRASGISLHYWHAAARMAAIVSGCYVLSSNRVSQRQMGEPRFGGVGFAYSPTGDLLQETSDASPCISVEIDLDLVRGAQVSYPCDVAELDADAAPPAATLPRRAALRPAGGQQSSS
jgi:N-carbamoylputrescine amidase